MATLKDVAELANVSMMTVSRVINESGYVKEETRQKIAEAIAKLNYYPNSLGRSLITNSVKVVAVLAPLESGVIENEPYYVRIMAGIESVLAEYSYDMLLSTQRVHSTPKNVEFDYCRPYMERKADGLILLAGGVAVSDSDFKLIEENQIPACMINIRPKREILDVVDTNAYEGFRMILERIYKAGHRKIAFGGHDIYNDSINRRYRSYIDFCEDKGLEIRDEYVFRYSHLLANGKKIVRDYLNLHDKPTAIAFSTDNFAVGAVEEAKLHGIRIPQDLSISGFDGSPVSQYMVPSLLTCSQPLVEMGRKAAELLMRRIKNPGRPYSTILLNTEIHEGESLSILNSVAR